MDPYTRNHVGQFAANVNNMHPDDQGTVRDYIDMVRGAYNPDEQTGLQLEDDASTIAGHYGIAQHVNPTVMANRFDKVLQTIPASIFNTSKFQDTPQAKKVNAVKSRSSKYNQANKRK